MARSLHGHLRAEEVRGRGIASHELLGGERGADGKVFGKTVPKPTFLRLPLTEAIVDMARAGKGIAVLSEWVAGTAPRIR